MRDLASGLDTRLTFDPLDKDAPSWFPAGDRVLYLSNVRIVARPVGTGAGTGSLGQIVAQRADGAGKPHDLATGTGQPRVSTDGRVLLYILDDNGRGRMRFAPISPDGTVGAPQALFHGDDEPNVRSFNLSADGMLLAFAAQDPTQRLDLFLTEFPSGNGRWQVETGATSPRFSPNGGELFYLSGSFGQGRRAIGHFMVVPVVSRPSVKLGAPRSLFDLTGGLSSFYDVAGDGQRILMSRPLAHGGAEARCVVLVQNWRSTLETRK